jgi:hypothetical protein
MSLTARLTRLERTLRTTPLTWRWLADDDGHYLSGGQFYDEAGFRRETSGYLGQIVVRSYAADITQV